MIIILKIWILDIAQKIYCQKISILRSNDFSKLFSQKSRFHEINDSSKTSISRHSGLLESSEFSNNSITRKFWIFETVVCQKIPYSRNIQLLENSEFSKQSFSRKFWIVQTVDCSKISIFQKYCNSKIFQNCRFFHEIKILNAF